MSRVYVGRLSYHAKEKDIERFFRGYGRIREINLKNGFGFVEFDDSRDAEDAVMDLNGRELLGDKVIIEHARGPARGKDDRYRGYNDRSERRPGWIDNQYGSSSHSARSSRYGPPVRTDYRVVVENLSSRVSWQDLKDYMRQSGEVTFADAHKQRKNEGIVEFSSYSDMHNAMKKLDGTELNGKIIKINEDNQHKRSKRSYSRSRSRSRSRTRSRSPRRSPRRSRSRRSRSGSRSRSHSHSRGRKSNSKSRSRSKSPRRSQSKSPRRSASPKKNKSQSRSRSRSASRSKSRSASPKD